jgi:hypothetical protein
MKKYCLLERVLQHLHYLVFNEKIERCSTLYAVNIKNDVTYLEYEFNREQIGFKTEGRQRCDSENYHYIVHTHPKSEYSYPSVEDIWRLVTEPSIKLSVIATTWGIYTLKQKENFKGMDFLNNLKAYKPGYEHEFKHWLDVELHEGIGKLQDRKKTRDINDHTLTPTQYMDVNLFLSNISKNLDIEIKLYPWQSIKLSPT